MYPISPANAGFRSPYPTSLPITSSSLPRLVNVNASSYERDSERKIFDPSYWLMRKMRFFFLNLYRPCSRSFSDLYRFSPTSLMPPHPGLSPHAHALASHALVSSAPKADHSTLDHNHRFVAFKSLDVAGGIWTPDSKTGHRLSLVCMSLDIIPLLLVSPSSFNRCILSWISKNVID